MNRAVIYARYSSLKQTEQSIDGQLHACIEYANRNNFVVVNQYIDRAKSGRNSNRPAFQQLLSDSRGDLFDYVLVYQYDRFGRNRREFSENDYILFKNKVRLISVTENVNEKESTSVIVKGLFESIAEYYSVDLSNKVKRGLKESLIARRTIGGFYMFGYKADENKKIVIVQSEAELVRQFFRMRLKHCTISEITTFARKSGFTNHGKEFQPQAIRKILSCEKYAGVYKNPYNESEILTDYYPKIISKDLFKLVQDDFQKLSHKAKNKGCSHGPATRHLLTGRIYNGLNGNSLVGTASTSKTKRVYRYYFDKKSDLKIPKEKTEDQIISSIQGMLKKDDVLEYLSKIVRVNILKNKNGEESQKLNYEIKELKEHIAKIKTAFLDAPQHSELRSTLVSDFENQSIKLKTLESQLQQYDTQYTKVISSLKNIKKYLAKKIDSVKSEEEKRNFIYVFLNSAFVIEGKLYIYLNIDNTEKISFDEFKQDLSDIQHDKVVRINNNLVV